MVVPQKIKIHLPHGPSIPLLGKYPKELKARSQISFMPLLIAALFTVTTTERQSKYFMDKWVSQMQYIHTMDYYSAFKKKEILTYVTTWVSFGDNMLSEINH